MRLATWNLNSAKARAPRLDEWLASAQPDVLCVQETKCSDEEFPSAGAERLGYQVAHHGEGRWNGVAILSRVGLDDVRHGFAGDPGNPQPEARAVSATCAGIRMWSVYVPNGRSVDDPHYAYKLAWLRAVRTALAAEQQPLVVCGDFNIAPTDDDVWDRDAFVGSTHVTVPEREALGRILALGLTDILPRPMKGDRGFSYWDYRAGMFHKNMGMRIDLVLASAGVAAAVQDAYVDREARKGKGPSDHAPVVVDADDSLSAANGSPAVELSAPVTGS